MGKYKLGRSKYMQNISMHHWRRAERKEEKEKKKRD
jgi:hypothetical protein